jgi:hypothetical protein
MKLFSACHLSSVYKGHPQEDFFLSSSRYPIFAVADGVTLKLDENGNYPNPSPAYDVAKIFCEVVVAEGEKIFNDATVDSIPEIFRTANDAVEVYNASHHGGEALYGATAAFVIVKEKRVFWGSICDSYVAHFDASNILQFKSPLTGYVVVNGKERANRYLNSGFFDVEDGDTVFLLTDGFEHYLTLRDFMPTFDSDWDVLDGAIKSLTERMTREDPDKFGHERSMIAINFS